MMFDFKHTDIDYFSITDHMTDHPLVQSLPSMSDAEVTAGKCTHRSCCHIKNVSLVKKMNTTLNN